MIKCTYCGKLGENALTSCSECGTALPSEQFEPRPPQAPTAQELRVRRVAIRGGIFWIVSSLGVLALGWIFPAWFLASDPITQRDSDLRLMNARVEGFLLCLITSFVFAVLALRSFCSARDSSSAAASK
jgi:hypothetical protein